jgi:DNA-binding NtrC family response regulator
MGIVQGKSGQHANTMTPNGTRMLMLVDAEPAQARLVSALAARAGWRTIVAPEGEVAIATLGTRDGMMLDAILIDVGDDIAPMIEELRARRPALPILMLTANNSIDVAVTAMRAGASDFLVKPIAPERLLAALEAAIQNGTDGGELRPLTEKIGAALGFDEIVGSAPKFRAALAIAAKAARARVPMLVEGESGVGKAVIAEAIHAASPRAKRPLVVVNCGSMPVNQIESELFGHEKGAFAGAFTSQIGKLIDADGGTLFLDEVGELPVDAQVKLLRVLQSGEVIAAGSALPARSRCPHCRRDQPHPARPRRGRAFPRRPVLSPRGGPADNSPVARTPRRRPCARPPFADPHRAPAGPARSGHH